jgi:hypothetical protein
MPAGFYTHLQSHIQDPHQTDMEANSRHVDLMTTTPHTRAMANPLE